MKNFFYGAAAAVVVVVGLFVVLKSQQTPEPQPVLGASSGNEHYNAEVFYNTVTEKNQVFANIGSSSTTPTTSLPSLTNVGHITIAAGQTTENASTTAVDANSIVQVQQELTTPIAGVTCNTNINASSSEATSVFASTTNTSLSGFKLTVQFAPVTNPFCYSFKIVN